MTISKYHASEMLTRAFVIVRPQFMRNRIIYFVVLSRKETVSDYTLFRQKRRILSSMITPTIVDKCVVVCNYNYEVEKTRRGGKCIT